MRLAVIADVHGNLRALDAVLADVARHAPDAIVNLGDCVSGPLAAAATADRLMAHGFVTVRGNHDRALVEQPASAMGESDRAAAAELTPAHFAWLAALPATVTIEQVLLCHGTPTSDLAYLAERVRGSDVTVPSPDELDARLGDVRATIVLGGHTHRPRVLRSSRGRLVVNPGSVGLPAFTSDDELPHVVENGSPHARYAVIDVRAEPVVQLIAVPYDWDAAARDATAAGRPDWAHALATGCARPPSS